MPSTDASTGNDTDAKSDDHIWKLPPIDRSDVNETSVRAEPVLRHAVDCMLKKPCTLRSTGNPALIAGPSNARQPTSVNVPLTSNNRGASSSARVLTLFKVKSPAAVSSGNAAALSAGAFWTVNDPTTDASTGVSRLLSARTLMILSIPPTVVRRGSDTVSAAERPSSTRPDVTVSTLSSAGLRVVSSVQSSITSSPMVVFCPSSVASCVSEIALQVTITVPIVSLSTSVWLAA